MNAQSPALEEVNAQQPPSLSLSLEVNRDPFILLLFFILVQLFYFPTWNAGFVTDFTGLAWRIETHRFWDFLGSFGFPSLQPLLHFFLALFYKSFGTNGFPWYLIFTTLHTVNGFLLFRVSRRLLRAFQVYQAEAIAFTGALLFLLSPYASEPVTWRVCFNFLLVSQLILFILRHTLRWLESGKSRYILYSLLLFATALLTFELAFTVPLFTTALVLLWRTQFPSKGLLPLWLKTILLPQILFILFYFILHKITLGVWIGHYGAAVHLRLVPLEMLANAYKYFAKHLLFARYWEHPAKDALFNAIQHNVWIITAFFIILSVLYIFFYKKLAPPIKLAGWFLLAFFLALAPVANLYFNYLLYIENDRYGYLPAMFLMLALATLLSTLPRWAGYSIFAIYLSMAAYFLQKTNYIWMEATQIYYSLLNDFRWYDKEEVYILNLPDNFQGCLLFRDYSRQNLAFADALRYVRRKPYDGKIYEIAQYNMTTQRDGVSAERKENQLIVPTFQQWGNWWWRGGVGAEAYEKAQYVFKPMGQSYELRLKTTPQNAVFIYQTGGKWQALE